MTRGRPGTLHIRLTALVAVILAATLGLSGALIYVVFAAYMQERLDTALRDTPILFEGGAPGESPPVTDPVASSAGAIPGEKPRVTPFVLSLGPDGTVLRTQAGHDSTGRSYTAVLPVPLPDVPASDDASGTAVFFDARSREPSGPPLRVKVSKNRLGNVLVLALSTTENELLLRRLGLIEAGVAASAMLVACAAAGWLVRRRLGPLRNLADTVNHLDPGGRGARVRVDPTTREVHDLSAATNHLLHRVDDALTREQTAQDALRRFIADASHELRTPITAISAYAQLFDLGAATRPGDLTRSMRGIQAETIRVRDLVEELLTLAAAEAPDSHHQVLPVDVADVIGQAVGAARDIDPRRLLATDVAIDTGAVIAEPSHLRRVLDNLLGNVRAHTPAHTRTWIRSRREQGRVIVEVVDDGPGLTREERAHMFDRFWRRERNRSSGGTGLGLSIVATLVRQWNGTVSATPTPGGGLTVTICLPAYSGDAPTPVTTTTAWESALLTARAG